MGMEDLQSSDEVAFINEQVQDILYGSIEAVLKDEQYREAMVPHWIDAICDGAMQELTRLNKPFKYIVSCIIMQKNGAGVHTATSAYWDTSSDNLVIAQYPDDKHKDKAEGRMYCICTAYGFAF